MRRRLLLPLAALAAAALVAGPAAAAPPNPPNDPEFPRQTGLIAIKAPEAWANGTGSGVGVAVVSSGIAKAHPDLSAKTDGGLDATGTEATTDTSGRGTHLAGIVAATTHNERGIAGVAPDARLLPFKAFVSDDDVEAVRFQAALEGVPASGAKVVLVDIPEGFPDDGIAALAESLRNLASSGISVVVGARSGVALGGAGLSVGTAALGEQGVAAPGRNVISTTVTTIPTQYGYGARSGTGQAAAHAAGAVAILRGLGANASQAADVLRSTKTGSGVIDVAAAVAVYTKPPPPPPTTTTTTKKPAAPATTAPPGPAPGAPAVRPGIGDIGGVSGPVLEDQAEPGEGEEAIVPPGADEFADSGSEGGGSIIPGGSLDDRPLALLAVGFGLLAGVGGGLSVTLRRLADAAV